MKNLKTNVFFKIGIIFVLILLLQIPTGMVRGLIHEREYVQESAIHEVSAKWGKGQTIAGPYISIPYDKYIKQTYTENNETKQRVVKTREWIYLLPEALNINGSIFPEKKHRGIYEVVVYDSELDISGTFNAIDYQELDVNPEDVHLDNASFNVGISDLKGVQEQVQLKWGTTEESFNSGTSTSQLVSSGIQAPISLGKASDTSNSFSLQLSLKGSQHVYFTPVGKISKVHLNSNWDTPSFNGTYLPDNHEVLEDGGFEADWKILHLNRNYPQSWKGNAYSIKHSDFGLNLLLPVDNYKRSDRVAKYAILFIVFTFLVFFFVEALNKVFIHPIQYLLVGIALVVFYTLLLSFSEHMLFNVAYMVSAILTLGLIIIYTRAILKSKPLAMMVSGILLILYGFIFTIIQMEDYALLIGSIGVFVILALVMVMSRKLDWYALKLGAKE